MDNPQYRFVYLQEKDILKSFKPYYKWITFNTNFILQTYQICLSSFKPYYKWITFNTGDGLK